MTRIIAEQGGLVVAEDGQHIVVIDRGNGAGEITAFVLLIVTLVFGGFGALVLLTPIGVPRIVGVALIAIGLATGASVYAILRKLRSARNAPLDAFTPVAVFDREQRTYRDVTGRRVPLNQIRIHRQMQLTSSSPRLVITTPHGTDVLKRANPFGGGIGNLDEVLTAALAGEHN
ncbi:hypothetical protein ACWDUN_04330 [Mycobacterium sp. NPDC003323]